MLTRHVWRLARRPAGTIVADDFRFGSALEPHWSWQHRGVSGLFARSGPDPLADTRALHAPFASSSAAAVGAARIS